MIIVKLLGALDLIAIGYFIGRQRKLFCPSFRRQSWQKMQSSAPAHAAPPLQCRARVSAR